MLFLRKLSIYLFGLLTLFLFYLTLTQTEKLGYWVTVLILAVFLVTKFLAPLKSSWREVLIFFGLIIPFILASTLFLIVVENLFLKYSFTFLVVLLSVLYLELLLRYWHQPEKYPPFSLVQFFTLASLVSLFFAATGLFAINISLALPFGFVALILSLLTFIFVNQCLWLNKLEIKKYFYYPIIISLIIFEIAGLLSWWPTDYYLKGFLTTILYFILVNLSLKGFKEIWERKKVLVYVVASVLIVVVSLVTARWT